MNVPQLRFKGFNEEWEIKKLEQQLTVNSGKDYKGLNTGNIPVYGTGGYMLSVNKSLSNHDAIGIGRKGTINKPYYLKAPFWTVDTLFYLIPKDNNDLNFLLFKIQKINWLKYDESTSIPSLSKNTINNVKTYIPYYEEQHKIGQFFNKLDDLITLHTKRLRLLKKKRDAYLQKLFPKAGQTTPQLRFKGFNEEWHEKYLKDVVQYENGKGHEQNISQNGDYIVVNSKYISSNGKIKKFTSMPLEILNKNMIVFVLSDVPNGKALAKALIIDKDNKYTLNQRIAGLTVDKNYNVLFIYYLINRNSYFLRFNDGVSQTNMSKSDVLSFKFLIPDLSEQQKIGALFAKLDHLIDLQNHKLQLLQELKKGYLQKMFV